MRSPATLVLALGLFLNACTGAEPAADGRSEVAESGVQDDLDDAATSHADDATNEPSTTDVPSPNASDPEAAESTPSPEGSIDDGSGSTRGATASPQQGAPTPIPGGTYTYATEGESQVGLAAPRPMPSSTTLVAPAADGQDHQVLVRDMRDDEGLGSVTETDLQYGVEGVVLHSIVTTTTVEVFGSNVDNVNALAAKPPVVIGPVAAEVGFVADVHLEGDGTTADGTITITGRETLTIGGTSVDVFVVQADFTFSGETDGEQHATWWVRPADLLTVREESRLEATSEGVTYTEEQTSQLRSLTPR